MQIVITDKDIEEAERMLLPNNCYFNDEGKAFIKDLSTLDLQAVPGSGKTTVLLAKLLILGKKKPFNDDAGILVISHTNVAVDEIKMRLGKYFPELFNYPNFVGTIQSFVDKYLAIPFYINRYNHHPYGIDDEIFDQQCEKFLHCKCYNSGVNWLKRAKNNNKKAMKEFLHSIQINEELDISGIKGLTDTKKDAYKSIKDFKLNCIKFGFLSYSDAFNLASIYLKTNPKIIKLLSLRFKYVFVDEMQDMSKEQCEILEQLFYNNYGSVFQRIGDTNQSIYDSNDNGDLCEHWTSRDKTLKLSGSQRLTMNNASVVEPFAISPQKIIGKRILGDGVEIKPCMIVYDKNKIDLVIDKFALIIKKLKEQGKIIGVKNEKYTAIGWRKKTDSPDKYSLSTYWKEFDRSELKIYKNITLGVVKEKVLSVVLKILLAKEKKINNQYFTKKSLIKFIKESDLTLYKHLNLDVINIYRLTVLQKADEALGIVRKCILELLELLQIRDTNINNFVGDDFLVFETNFISKSNNYYEKDGIKIQVQTVHSVKGQTYTGVLYLETFYKGKYESERLDKKFIDNLNLSKKDNSKSSVQSQAARMVYVGFSRPTHLLCFAVQKDRFDKYLSSIDENLWNIVYV